MIRILLVNDLPTIGESVAVALRTKGMCARSCGSLKEAIDVLKRSRDGLDVVLIEYSHGGCTPDELLSCIAHNQPRCRALIMTRGLSEVEQRRLAGLGAAGVFCEQGSFSDLVTAVNEVAAGRTWFGMQTVPTVKIDRLSPQESRASELVLEGLANKEIAARLSVSESCVKGLLHRTFLKLNVRTRGQLIRVLMDTFEAGPEKPDVAWEMQGMEPEPEFEMTKRLTVFGTVPQSL